MTKKKWHLEDITVRDFVGGEWIVRVDVSNDDERELSIDGTCEDAGTFCLKNDQITTRETVDIEFMLNCSAVAEALLADAIEVYWTHGAKDPS